MRFYHNSITFMAFFREFMQQNFSGKNIENTFRLKPVIFDIFFVIILFNPISVSNASSLKQVALVIGNSSYMPPNALKNPQSDARLIAGKLKAVGYTLVGGQALLNLNHTDFVKAIQQFISAANGADVALIYFAGHGVQASGENYLIPVDANPITEQDMVAQSVSASVVTAAFRLLRAHINFFIIDACRNNPWANTPLYAISRSLGSPDKGLAVMKTPPATIIWFSTSPGAEADDGIGDNSPYALAISHYLGTPNLDLYGFFNKSGIETQANSRKSDQNPWLSAEPLDGLYYFMGQSGQSEFVSYTDLASSGRSFQPQNLLSSNSSGVATMLSNANGESAKFFARGINVPGRHFQFGSSYEDVNHLLDSSFSIKDYDALPKAEEYKSTDVRYFWVYLYQLPVVKSALANLLSQEHCIDKNSYIVFFFKDGKYFRSSIRLSQTQECANYDNLWQALAGSKPDDFSDGVGLSRVNIARRMENSYYVISIAQDGVVEEIPDFL